MCTSSDFRFIAHYLLLRQLTVSGTTTRAKEPKRAKQNMGGSAKARSLAPGRYATLVHHPHRHWQQSSAPKARPSAEQAWMQLRPHPQARLHCSGSSQPPQRLRNENRSAMCTFREQRCRYELLRRIFEVPYTLIIGKLTFPDVRTDRRSLFEPVLKTPLPPQEGVSKIMIFHGPSPSPPQPESVAEMI